MAVLKYENNFEDGWGVVYLDGYQPTPGSDGAYETLKPYINAPGDLPSANGTGTHTRQFSLVGVADGITPRSGTQCAKTVVDTQYAGLDADGRLKCRSEIKYGGDTSTAYRFKDEVESWIGFSIFWPAANSTNSPPYLNMTQIRLSPNSGTLHNANGNWRASYETVEDQVTNLTLGPIVEGKWTDFVYRIRPSRAGTGILQIWVDGVRKANLTNINYYVSPLGSAGGIAGGGGYYGNYYLADPGTRDDNFPLVVYLDSIRIAQGSNGYDLVDPARDDDVAPTAPAGSTTFDTTGAGYEETGTWASNTTNSWLLATRERIITSAGAGTATLPFYTAAAAGTVQVWIYAGNSQARDPAAKWALYSGATLVSNGSFAQNGSVNQFYYAGSHEVASGALSLVISNTDCTLDVAIDTMAYIFTESVATDDIEVVTTNGVEYASGTGTTFSVDVPAGAQVGDLCLVTFNHVGYDTITVNSPLLSVCTSLRSSLDDDRSHICAYRVIDGTETAFTATVSASVAWTAGCRVLRNVDPDVIFDVHEASHTNYMSSTAGGGTYHQMIKDNSTPTTQDITTQSTDAAVVQYTMINSASAISDASTDQAGTTEVFKQITNNPKFYCTLEKVATPSLYAGGTHTYTGAAANAETITLVFSLKKATPAAATLVFANQELWDPPITDSVAKNSGQITHDPVGSAISGGTPPYTVFGVSAYDGCAVELNSDVVLFTPTTGFDGVAQYIAFIHDAGTPVQYVNKIISVDVTNVAPVATDQAISVKAGASGTYDMAGWATDSESDALTYVLATATSGNLTASITDNVLTVVATAEAGEATETGITYYADDGSNSNQFSATKTITISVVTPAATPTVTNFAVVVDENSLGAFIDVLANSADAGGLPLTVAQVNDTACVAGDVVATTHGDVRNDAGRLYYVPDVGNTTADSFTWKVTNGTNLSANGTVSITFTPESATDDVTYTSLTVTDTVRVGVSGFTRYGDLQDACGIYASLGGTLTYAVTTQPATGTLTVDADTGMYEFAIPDRTTAVLTGVITATTADDTQAFTITLTPVIDSELGHCVASWNAFHFDLAGGRNSPDVDLVAATLSELEADIICLNEFPGYDGYLVGSGYTPDTLAAELVSRLGMTGYVLRNALEPDGDSISGNVLLYRGTLISSASGTFAQSGTTSTRVWVKVTVENAGGERITVFGTHLNTGSQTASAGSTPDDQNNAYNRLQQKLELIELANAETGLVIVIGDMNETDIGAVPGVLSYDASVDAGWQDAYKLVTPVGPANTTSADRRDICWLVNNAICSGFTTVDNLTDSDHRPIVVNVFRSDVVSHTAPSGALGRILNRTLF